MRRRFVKGGAIAIECSLVDQGIPLFTRAARARRAAGDRQWWLNELSAAQGADALIQQFTVLALYRSMAIDDIVALAGTIGTMLDILPERHWLGLADAAHVPWHRPRRPRRQQITTTALPASMSPRLASLLIFRVSTATGQLIRHRYLLDYRGNDRAILEAIIEVVTEHAFDKPQAWGAALPEIAHAYGHKVRPSRTTYMNKSRGRDMPLLEARRICAEAGAYPLQLVSTAEALLAAQTGAESIPVGKIAARDEWFVEG
jgi:hypothetical protein